MSPLPETLKGMIGSKPSVRLAKPLINEAVTKLLIGSHCEADICQETAHPGVTPPLTPGVTPPNH